MHTILVIEDDPSLLDLLRTLLEVNGYEVLTAADGMDAVDCFREHADKISLVISDLGLPRLGGWEAFQQMKALKPSVKALLASGYFEAGLREEAIRMGAIDFLQKPYRPPEIIQRISAILSS